MENKIASIYLLVDPRDEETRYVGLTTQTLAKRLKAHLSHKGRTHRSAWVQSLLSLGLKPKILLVRNVPVEEGPAAEILEIKLRKSAGCDLVNLTEGGEGTLGHVHTLESRAKMSVSHRGKKPSLSTRKKLRNAKLNQSAETRAKIGEANSRREVLQRTRDKIAAARIGKPLSLEHRVKLSVIGRKRVLTEEERKKISEAARARWADKNWRQKQAWFQ